MCRLLTPHMRPTEAPLTPRIPRRPRLAWLGVCGVTAGCPRMPAARGCWGAGTWEDW